jgi:hypothetical protein
MREPNKHDLGTFWTAMLPRGAGLVISKGYINPKTLEVVLWHQVIEAKETGIDDFWIDDITDRDCVDKHPDRWLEVPKFDEAAEQKYGLLSRATFIRLANDFFIANGIDVEIIDPNEQIPDLRIAY